MPTLFCPCTKALCLYFRKRKQGHEQIKNLSLEKILSLEKKIQINGSQLKA